MMRRTALFAFACLLSRGTASAATLSSAPALANFAGAFLECIVQNVSSSALTVTIEHLDFSGDVVDKLGPTSMPPGSLNYLWNSDLTAASCRVTVDGKAKNVRAQANYYSPAAGRFTASLPVE